MFSLDSHYLVLYSDEVGCALDGKALTNRRVALGHLFQTPRYTCGLYKNRDLLDFTMRFQVDAVKPPHFATSLFQTFLIILFQHTNHHGCNCFAKVRYFSLFLYFLGLSSRS